MNRRRVRLAATAVAMSVLGAGTLVSIEMAAGAGVVASKPSSSTDRLSLFGHMLTRVPAGFVVIEQGPLTAQQFASYSPNPATAASALRALQRDPRFLTSAKAWIDSGSLNGIVDLVVALPNSADAAAYRAGQVGPLDSYPGTKKETVPGIPGAVRYAFLTTVPANGVEQVVIVSAGRYVASLRFVSLATAGNADPFTAAQANAMSLDQYRLLRTAPGGGRSSFPPTHRSTAFGWLALAGAAVLVLALTTLVMRRRRTLGGGPTVERQLAGGGPGFPPAEGPAEHRMGVPADRPDLPPAPLDPVLHLPMPAAGTAAGWLVDPAHDDGRVRYWNGTAWTKNWGEA